VAGTSFDLQAPEGVHLAPHLEEGKVDGGGKPGFDHCFVIDGYDPAVSKGKSEEEEKEIRSKARFMALLADPLSGRAMELKGTQPGLQVYTANWLDGPAQHQAVCLETEHFPNALNDPVLSKQNDIVLQPGETYRHFTSHRFFTLSPLPTAQA
jgi:aldose 1-epimerase